MIWNVKCMSCVKFLFCKGRHHKKVTWHGRKVLMEPICGVPKILQKRINFPTFVGGGGGQALSNFVAYCVAVKWLSHSGLTVHCAIISAVTGPLSCYSKLPQIIMLIVWTKILEIKKLISLKLSHQRIFCPQILSPKCRAVTMRPSAKMRKMMQVILSYLLNGWRWVHCLDQCSAV